MFGMPPSRGSRGTDRRGVFGYRSQVPVAESLRIFVVPMLNNFLEMLSESESRSRSRGRNRPPTEFVRCLSAFSMVFSDKPHLNDGGKGALLLC